MNNRKTLFPPEGSKQAAKLRRWAPQIREIMRDWDDDDFVEIDTDGDMGVLYVRNVTRPASGVILTG